jgi:hypothetical protein
MKLLNLDELVKTEREIVLLGENYAVAEQSVGMMVSAMKASEKAQKTGNEDELFLEMVETAQAIIPTCPRDVLHRMNITQLARLIEFGVASDDDVDALSQSGEGETEGK